jgi:hypothetical protein
MLHRVMEGELQLEEDSDLWWDDVANTGNELFPPRDWEAPRPPLLFHPDYPRDDENDEHDRLPPRSLDWDE